MGRSVLVLVRVSQIINQINCYLLLFEFQELLSLKGLTSGKTSVDRTCTSGGMTLWPTDAVTSLIGNTDPNDAGERTIGGNFVRVIQI